MGGDSLVSPCSVQTNQLRYIKAMATLGGGWKNAFNAFGNLCLHKYFEGYGCKADNLNSQFNWLSSRLGFSVGLITLATNLYYASSVLAFLPSRSAPETWFLLISAKFCDTKLIWIKFSQVESSSLNLINNSMSARCFQIFGPGSYN